MSAPIIILASRTHTDWRSFKNNPNVFFKQRNELNPVAFHKFENYWNYAERWQKDFGQNFFDAVMMVQNIAWLNWRSVRSDLVIRGKKCLMPFLCNNSNWVLLLTDEDDWYNPKVVKHVLREYDSGAQIIHWPQGMLTCGLENGKVDAMCAKVQKGSWGTNNFALTDKIMKIKGINTLCPACGEWKNQEKMTVLETIMTRHSFIHCLIEPFSIKVSHCDQPLSFYNRNWCSVSCGEYTKLSKSNLKTIWRAVYNQTAKRGLRLQKDLAWATPLYNRLLNVYKMLLREVI